MIFTSILRQALVVMIAHTPIRSVRTFFLWKLTAMTDLQMGHLILMMPSTASGSASNNLLFLQHGQATCTSCISFRLPQEASQKGMSNWPLEIFYFPLHCLPWLKSYGSDKYSISNICSVVNNFRSHKKILTKFYSVEIYVELLYLFFIPQVMFQTFFRGYIWIHKSCLYTKSSLSLVDVFLSNIFFLCFWPGDSETRRRQAYPPTYPWCKKSAVNHGYIHITSRCCFFSNCLECNMFVSCPLRIMGRYEICK